MFRRSGIRAGELVAVVGAGFLGSSSSPWPPGRARASWRCRGARPRSAGRARWAADAVPLRERAAAIEAARRSAGDRPFDVAVEAVGNQVALDVASALVREGGRLVIAGFHQDGLRSVDLGSWNWRALEIVNAHERDPRAQRDGVVAAAAAVAEGRLEPSALYARYPLERIGAAFQAMEERPDGFVKALVTP